MGQIGEYPASYTALQYLEAIALFSNSSWPQEAEINANGLFTLTSFPFFEGKCEFSSSDEQLSSPPVLIEFLHDLFSPLCHEKAFHLTHHP